MQTERTRSSERTAKRMIQVFLLFALVGMAQAQEPSRDPHSLPREPRGAHPDPDSLPRGEEVEDPARRMREDGFRAIEQMLEMAQAFRNDFPELLAKLEGMRPMLEGPPEAVEHAMQSIGHLRGMLDDLQRLHHENEERYLLTLKHHRLEFQIESLAEQFRQSPAKDNREKAEAEIKFKLRESFELGQQLREMEAQHIEDEIKKEVARIRDALKKRQENKDKVIDRRLQVLMEGEDPLAW